jgi:hypothetical protein
MTDRYTTFENGSDLKLLDEVAAMLSNDPVWSANMERLLS